MLEGTEVLPEHGLFRPDPGAIRRSPTTSYIPACIDEFFGYRLGALKYRSVRFETEVLPDTDNYQGNAVVNYTEREVPYTRVIEHKHFEFGKQPKTVISREYSAEWKRGDEPYYPVNDEENNALYAKYKQLAAQQRERDLRRPAWAVSVLRYG